MSESVPPPAPPSASGRAGCFLIVLLVLAAGGWWWWNQRNAPAGAAGGGPGKGGGKGGKGGAGGPVPVLVAEVKQEDFEDWLNIAGTVTPLHMVTVRSRVDGELQKVFFTEGQTVKAGDLLAQIDPRPFEVQLEQAKSQLARDEALLENARADYARYEALLEAAAAEGRDVPLSAILPRDDYRPRFDAVMTWAVGVETHEVSTLDLARYADSTHNWAVREGLGTVVAHAADGLDVRLQAPVTHIDWSGRGVRVESTAGTLDARAVIVTVPTSVLAQGAIRFTPALPQDLRDAAGNLPLGVVNKVFFALAPGSFDPRDARQFIGRADTSRTCSYTLFPARQPLLCAFFGGDLSKDLETRGELEQFARDELRDIFGASINGMLGATRSTGWGLDPHSLGSYSAARPGHADARAVLARPVAPNLCFAGEACSAEFYGTLHGAWLSGQAAADALL